MAHTRRNYSSVCPSSHGFAKPVWRSTIKAVPTHCICCSANAFPLQKKLSSCVVRWSGKYKLFIRLDIAAEHCNFDHGFGSFSIKGLKNTICCGAVGSPIKYKHIYIYTHIIHTSIYPMFIHVYDIWWCDTSQCFSVPDQPLDDPWTVLFPANMMLSMNWTAATTRKSQVFFTMSHCSLMHTHKSETPPWSMANYSAVVND